MNLIELTNSVMVCQDISYYQVNMVCVHLESELVFVDTCTNTKLASEFRKNMEEKFGKKKATLVITHANGDHFQAIQAFDGIPVVVSEPFIERVKQYSISSKKKKILQQARTFTKEITFGSESNQLLFRLVGGHTGDSIYGFFPPEKIVIAGDNLISNMPQYFPFADTDLDKWIICLKSWEQLDAEKFICGHGGITRKDHVINVRRFIEKLKNFLDNSLKEGLTVEEVLKHPDFPKYFEKDPDEWIEKGTRQCYANMRKL
ncbi:MAG: MBL fold metallo-hydrolase [Candidatus Hodarchaeales archaeon]|jgi:glyoxylase-like metal-dependent hydrolase (beta-lactamase superfamily II)